MTKRNRFIAFLLAVALITATTGSMTATVYGASNKITKSKVNVSLSAGAERITIKWKKIKNASGYQVYRATSKKGTYKKIKTVKKASSTKYTNKKLKAGKTYYYKVRAYNKINGKMQYSKFSKIKSKKALTKKAVAKKYIGKSASSLISAIGKPEAKDYAQSCFGPGEDGEWKYKGFTVYTYRENGREIVQSVE